MKYSSKMAENRFCEDFNSELKNQTEQAYDRRGKAIRFKKKIIIKEDNS